MNMAPHIFHRKVKLNRTSNISIKMTITNNFNNSSIWVLYGNKLSLILVEQETAWTSTSRVWGLGETKKQQTLFECHVAAMQSSLCGRQGFCNQSGGYEFLPTQEWNHYKSASLVISVPVIGKITLYSQVPTPTQKLKLREANGRFCLHSRSCQQNSCMVSFTTFTLCYIYSCPWYSLFMCIYIYTHKHNRESIEIMTTKEKFRLINVIRMIKIKIA